MRLSRRQMRALRNPLPKDAKKIVVDASVKESVLNALKKEIADLAGDLRDEGIPVSKKDAFDLAQKHAPYLAAQSLPRFRNERGVKGEPKPLAAMYLGIDERGLLEQAAGSPQADNAQRRIAVEIEKLRATREKIAESIQEQIERRQSSRKEAQVDVPDTSVLPALDGEQAKGARKFNAYLRTKGLEHELSELQRALRLEQTGQKRPSSKKLLIDLINKKEQSEAVDRNAAGQQAESQSSSGGLFAFGAALPQEDPADGGETDDQPEGDEDKKPSDYDETAADPDDGVPWQPKTGPASDRDSRFKVASKLGRIRGSVEREAARKARTQGFGGDTPGSNYLLSYRRPQSRSPGLSANTPALYAPPEDVLETMQRIQDADTRTGLPRQFQDILIYVLTKPVVVGRNRVIPKYSVEVYNKGTLVGTFGNHPGNTNIRKATTYAGQLVGLDFGQQPYTFKKLKKSRMDSRIWIATQGEESAPKLIAPSFAEFLAGEGGGDATEMTQDDIMGAAVGGSRSNPARRHSRQRQFLGSNFSPTRDGYRITSGPLRGNDYTTQEFAHGCKLALLLDLMHQE